MIDDAYRYGRLDRLPRRRRRRLRVDLLAMTAAAAIVVGALPRFTADNDVAAEPEPSVETFASSAAPAAASPGRDAWLFDPTPALGARTLAMRPVVELHAALEPELLPAAAPPTAAPIAAPPAAAVAALVAPLRTPRPQAVQQTARLVPSLVPQTVPLPVRRPSDLLAARATSVAALAPRPGPSRTRMAAQENAEAERSFFDTVFGAKPDADRPDAARPQALAYAGVDTGTLGVGPRRATAPQAGGGTAVYDISAARVTLPSGEVLEAHSGLGPSMDNPHNVHLRMRGSTPPGTYDLTEREALFHGVRALRLHPVGGPAAIHNRNGLLTHTYMLGSSGASNGCISFRNYPRFLQAYLSGEVRRVVVVAGAKGDRTPSFASRLFGASASAE